MPGFTRRKLLRRVAILGCGALTGELLACCAPDAARGPATPIATPVAPAVPTRAGAPPATAKPTLAPLHPKATPQPTPTPAPYLAVVRGARPGEITARAIAALGGIERFVKAGADVIIKPNICVAHQTYEYAATTNPEVVATLVRLCLGAGARRVRVMDLPFSGTAEAAYVQSGIAEAVRAAGGQMELMSSLKYRQVGIPQGQDLKRCQVYGEILDADLVINVPIAKHHSLARLTLGHKNLMGVISDRGALHHNLGQRLADLASLVRPALTVVDAVRILVRNGPSGGNLADVRLTNTVIASADMVAADAYATRLFGLQPADIAYIPAAARMNLGRMDLSALKIEELEVG